MLWIDGRFAWPVVVAVVFSTVALLAVDFAWRTVQVPVSLLAIAGAGILLAGNIAIFIVGRRTL